MGKKRDKNKQRLKYGILGISLITLGGLSYGIWGKDVESSFPIKPAISTTESIAEETGLAFSSEDLIRFHVVANSDSAKDQELKTSVRNKLLHYIQPLLSQAENAVDAQILIGQHLDQIQAIALAEVEQFHESYGVRAEIADFSFPDRAYGDWMLPAGAYTALKVSLGKAEGQNWWCVLFPPLCFIEGTGDVVLGDFEKGASEEALSPVIATPGEKRDSAELQIRSKLWEWWQADDA